MRNVYLKICATLILFTAPIIHAQQVEFANSFLYTGGPHSVIIIGDYAYLAGDRSLQILSIVDLSSPSLVGGFTFRKPVCDVYVVDNIAFVIDQISSLFIIDITDKRQPSLIASTEGYQGAEFYQGVRVSGNYAYIAGVDGLIIFDISDASNPVLVGHDPVGRHYGLAIRENRVFTIGSGGLIIYDVTDQTNPLSIGQCYLEGDPIDITVAGDYAYVTANEFNDNYSALIVIDISDLEHPTQTSSCETPGFAHKISLEGQHAFVADGDAGFQIINISDPEYPFIEESVDNPGWNVGIYISDNIAFLGNTGAENCGLYLFDLEDLGNPLLRGYYRSPEQNSRLHGNDDYVGVAGGLSGVYFADLNPPDAPVITGVYDSLGHATSVFCRDSYAYISTGNWDFHIVDISEPSDPLQIGTYESSSLLIDAFIDGSHAYISRTVSYQDGGFEIVDISDPASPYFIASYDAPYRLRGLFVNDLYACISGRYFGLEFIDISNPLEPTLAGSFDEIENAYGVYLSDTLAFVAAGFEGLCVLDISNPGSINRLGSCETAGYANDIVISGELAYMACGDSGVAVIDISVPDDPQFLAGNSSYRGHDLYVSDDLIYMLNVNSLIIFRYDPETGIVDVVSHIPRSFSLSQNYPNPFNARTTIRYALPKRSDVEIEIFDIMGRRIKTLVSMVQPAGSHTATWTANDVSSGVYFYRIRAGDYSESRSCILLK